MRKLFIISFLLFETCAMAQENSFFVEKKECKNEFKGNKLVLNFANDTALKKSSTYSYDLSYFIGLSDSIKILLISELLKYESDTTDCCLDITSWSFNGIEGCGGKPKGIKHYTIQVDALFMINRLCWPKLMELYSCSPVLYDKQLNEEINSNPEKILCVFKEYKKWFAKCQSDGKIPKYFPFNDGRYVWYNGRKSIVPKD